MKSYELSNTSTYFINLISSFFSFPIQSYTVYLNKKVWKYDSAELHVEILIENNDFEILVYFTSLGQQILNKDNSSKVFVDKESAGEYVKFLMRIRDIYVFQHLLVFEFLMSKKQFKLIEGYTVSVRNNFEFNNNIIVHGLLDKSFIDEWILEFYIIHKEESELVIHFMKTRENEIQWNPKEKPDRVFKSVEELIIFLCDLDDNPRILIE